MKKRINCCTKCGKELSNFEKKSGNTKCENCMGKQAKKTKNVLVGIGSFTGCIMGIVAVLKNMRRKF